MGDARNDDLRVGFDSRLKLRFCGSKVTSDAGLLAYRELDQVLGLTEMGAEVLTDSRLGMNKQHLIVPLLRQSIYSRLAGYRKTISVNWQGVGTSATGKSVQRLSNTDTDTKADWSAAKSATWGLLNSGQSPQSSGGVSGDYNGNTVVDAADYVVWRKAQSNGATSLLNRSGSISGPVGPADYDFWRSRFGATSGSGTAIDSSTVPEPATWLLGAVAWGACASVRRTRRRGRFS